MGSPNGGIIGVINPTSFGKCTVTSATGSTTVTTQSGTRIAQYLVVAGGGGGGEAQGAGAGAGGYRTGCLSVCGSTPYPITVGAGGAGGTGGSGGPGNPGSDGTSSIFSTITSTGWHVYSGFFPL